ncbi:hypothetical protein LUZ63_016952 [Rhynchospora breviuscula]|uniref:Protein kinase domain-containing protein n=1 Tax=Rhynchospora breviuscula TaxID=2022672 RepID=A0A9Q0C1K0_9POAL|nr:hypothetical protein LUZ63_016952 [Rhynchospora breviuscula]
MSTEASSSSVAIGVSSSPDERKIEILSETENSVKECCVVPVGRQLVRSKYLRYKLQNPYKPNSQAYSKESVVMDIYGETDDEKSMRLMLNTTHLNILEAYLLEKADDGTYEVYITDEFIGSLREFYTHEFSSFHGTNYIPKDTLTKFIRNIVDALIFLHDEDLYHGAISLDTLLYCHSGCKGKEEYLVKLANFKTKCKTTEEAQLEDWHDLGTMLLKVLNKAVLQNPAIFVQSLQDVVTHFQNVTLDSLMQNMTYLQKNFTFFWTIDDRRKFAMHIYLWCEDERSRTILKTRHNNIVNLPWTTFQKPFGGVLLRSIAAYNNKTYNGGCIIDLLRVVSACYTHSTTISQVNKIKQVDNFILEEYPRLFYDLLNIQRQEQFLPLRT